MPQARLQLRQAMEAQAELNTLPTGIGRPGRDWHRADLRDLVEAQQQRRVQPQPRHPRPELRCPVLDFSRQGREERRQRALIPRPLGDHVQRAARRQEFVDRELLSRPRRRCKSQLRVLEEGECAVHGGGPGRFMPEYWRTAGSTSNLTSATPLKRNDAVLGWYSFG